MHCNENGYYSIYDSDRYGFNNPDEEWEKNKIEYLVLGDSFVHGNCVNRPHDISSVLRTLSKKAVINLGYDGNRGPLAYYATLREYIRPNTKNILFIYYEGNDILDLEGELKSEILTKYLTNLNFSQKLIFEQDKIDRVAYKILENEIKKKKEIKNSFYVFIKLHKTRDLFQRFLKKSYKVNIALQPEFFKIIELANDLAIKNKSKMHFIYLPQYDNFKKDQQASFHTHYNQIKKKL